MDFLNHIETLPPDPLFGILQRFRQDSRPDKVNLTLGTYKNSALRPWILPSVKEAEHLLWEEERSKDYLSIGGDARYIDLTQKLVFGEVAAPIVGVQSVGGTGALRLAAEFLRKGGCTQLALSNPTWGNHPRIFQAAGFQISSYDHFDWEEPFSKIERGSVVVLQPCCHNPTGCDFSLEEWERIKEIIQKRKLIPLFDFAYQGFGSGVEEDAAILRLFMEWKIPFLVAVSHSKNFGLYKERTGALFLHLEDENQCEGVRSQLHFLIRTLYSNPPAHGALLVSHILSSLELKNRWLEEVEEMRFRIGAMRAQLAQALPPSFSIDKQRGMFSYLHLPQECVERLRQNWGIYLLAGGRINVAGLSAENVGYVAKAILHETEKL